MFKTKQNYEDSNGWSFFFNGKLKLKQNQFFYAHRLVLKIKQKYKSKFGFSDINELQSLFDFSINCKDNEILEIFNSLKNSLSPELIQLVEKQKKIA